MHIFHKYETLRISSFSKNFSFDVLESSHDHRFHGLNVLKVLEHGYYEKKSICIKCGKIKISYGIAEPYHLFMQMSHRFDIAPYKAGNMDNLIFTNQTLEKYLVKKGLQP